MDVLKLFRNLLGKIPLFSDESDRVKVKKELTVVAGVNAHDTAANTVIYPAHVDSSGHLCVNIAGDGLGATSPLHVRTISEADGEAGLAGDANSTNDIGTAGTMWLIQITYVAAAARTPIWAEEDSGIAIGSINCTGAGNFDLTAPVMMEGGQKLTIGSGNAADAWHFKAFRVY